MNLFTKTPSNAVADSAPRKFMFDQSFDQMENSAARAAERNKPVTMKMEQLEQLKREAYDQGFAAGKKTAQDEDTARLSSIFGRIDEQITRMLHKVDEMYKDQDSQLRTVIMAVAKKLLPNFAAKHGLSEIQAILATIIGEMQHEPRLVVRVNESELDAINAKLADIIIQKAYSGKIVVLADPDINTGDCRVEWADGGIERKADAIWQSVESIIAPSSSEHHT